MTGRTSGGEFQDYLGLLGRMLRLRTAQRESIEEELRAHMEERFAALTARGIEPEQAVSMALAEFGDAAALAAEFTAVARLQKRRWMMRFTVGSIAATVLLTMAAVSMWPDRSGELAGTAAHAQQVEQPAPPAAEAPAVKQDANARTQAKLEARIDAEFTETPLDDVLAFLAEKAGVQVYVDRRALDDVGISPQEAIITFDLKDVPVEMVLRLVLRQLDLGYMLDHGVVIATTSEEIELSLEIEVYTVRDLVQPPGKPAAAAGRLRPPGGGYVDAAGYPGEEYEAICRVDALMEVITSTVEPSSWQTVGGPGTIAPYRGTLVIGQTYQVHRKIEKLLRGLRAAVPEQPAATTPTAPVAPAADVPATMPPAPLAPPTIPKPPAR